MKKLKLFFLLAGLLSMWQVKAQISPPVSSQTIASGNQNIVNQTTTGTEKWYNFQNTTADVHVIVDIMQQGVKYKCNELKFYIKTGGSLFLISKDSLYAGENRLEVFAPNKAIGSNLYVQVINKTYTCTTCTPQNPFFNLSIVNRLPGCGGYIQPTCEYVKDGGFEYFNAPCSTIDILQSYTTDLDAQFAPCFWTLPGPLGVFNTTRGSPDYFTACAPIAPSSLSTNAYNNYFNGPFTSATHLGDGYAGFFCQSPPTYSGSYREYISQQLATNLTVGIVYKISMFVKLSRHSARATDDIQALLSTVTPTQTLDNYINTALVPGGTQLINMTSTAITDAINWTLLTATFTATGNYSKLTIGNFLDDLGTTIVPVSPTVTWLGAAAQSYYFIDDVSIVQKPTFSVTPVTATYCPSSPPTVTLSIITPSLGATYSWTSSIGTVSTGTSIVVSPTTSINYTVTSNLGGCLNTAYTSITLVPPYPVPALVTSTNVVCPGGIFDITTSPPGASGFTGYTYTVNVLGTLYLGYDNITGSVPTYSTGVNNYTVIIDDPSGVCPVTQTLSIYVQPYPSYTIAPNPLCAGATATLTASGLYVSTAWGSTAGMTIDWGDGGGAEFATDSTKTHIFTTPGTYTIEVTGQNYLHCPNISTLTLLVTSSTPTLIASPNQSICPGATRTLTASGATSYTWQPGGVVSNSIVVTPSVTTIYTVTGTGVCGGTAIKTITVTVLPKPTISITSTLSNLCSAASSGSTTVLSYATSPGGSSATWVATNATSGAILPVPITGGVSTATVNLSSYINYTANINFVATYTSSGGCIGTQTITLYACCTPTAGVAKYTNTTFASGPTFTATAIILSGTITINAGTLSFLNTNVYMDPNTKIILKGTSAFAPQRTYMHGCNAMWDGIYSIGSSNNITIASCRIEDAKRAIVDSLGTARLNVSNSYFNKNNIGVVIKGTKPSTSSVNIRTSLFTCSTISVTPGTWFSLDPALTNSTAIGAFPSTTMLPPYSSYNSLCGIHLLGAMQAGVTNSLIPIGVSTTTTGNIYDKMKVGIISANSNIDVQKSVFQNITSAMNNTGFANSVGVLALNISATNVYNKIGGSVANKNIFYNNEYGVYNVGKSTLNVTYNKFDNHFISVLVTSNNNNQIVNILNNNIYKSKVGISCYNNAPQIKATIKDNNIDNSSAIVGAYNSNYAIYCGESVAPTSAANTTSYTVSNNNIKNYYNGIWATQTLSTTINDNEVHMAQDNANDHWQRGIKVDNCNTPKVNNNIVDIPSLNQWGYWQLGIDMGSNQVPRVQCNSVTNLCMGLTFSGANITASGDGIIGNYLQNNAYGIWLLNNGEIGNQFKPGPVSADNAWAGYTCGSCLYTFAQGNSNVIGGGSKLYTRSSGIYNLPISKATNDGSSGTTSLFGTNTSAASSGTCLAATATPTNVRLGGSSASRLMQNGEDDADDYNLNGPNMGRSASVNLAEADDINMNAISKRAINHYQLYRSVKLQGIDVKASQAMLSFMNSAKTDNVGLFFAVDSLLHNAETDSLYIPSARYLNNSITVKNKVDKTHKAFNELYASYLTQRKTLKSTEISSLEDIAYLCPAIYGNAVYQARAVLFGIKKQSYISDCEKASPSKSSKKIAQDNTVTNEIVVYPNPTNNELFVLVQNYSQVRINLYNIMGELVINKTIDNGSVAIDVSKLASGIYVYKVYANDVELKIGKLIISK